MAVECKRGDERGRERNEGREGSEGARGGREGTGQGVGSAEVGFAAGWAQAEVGWETVSCGYG